MQSKKFAVNKIPEKFEMCQCQNLQLHCDSLTSHSDPDTEPEPKLLDYGQGTVGYIVEFWQQYSNGEWLKQKHLTTVIPYSEETTLPKFTEGIYYYYIKEGAETKKKGHLTVRKCCR